MPARAQNARDEVAVVDLDLQRLNNLPGVLVRRAQSSPQTTWHAVLSSCDSIHQLAESVAVLPPNTFDISAFNIVVSCDLRPLWNLPAVRAISFGSKYWTA